MVDELAPVAGPVLGVVVGGGDTVTMMDNCDAGVVSTSDAPVLALGFDGVKGASLGWLGEAVA